MENKRIPFDWEKYQSGEYQAVCRDGAIPEQIVYYPNAKTDYVFSALVHDELKIFTKEGFYYSLSEKDSRDLFLIPKPKKFQAWVNLYSNGECYSYETEKIAKNMIETYVKEDRALVETRLIEWEG